MSDEKDRRVVPFSDAPRRPAPRFYPMTGNPEAHDYADFVRSLQEGAVVPLRDSNEKPPI